MESFQKAVLIAAIIILIIVLIFIAFALNQGKKSNWPPLVGDCPDFWVDLSGNGQKCVNQQDLGNGTCKPAGTDQHLTMDFTQPAFSGSNGLCAKYTWANNCGVSWDGITYGVSNPCNAPGAGAVTSIPTNCPASALPLNLASAASGLSSLETSAKGFLSSGVGKIGGGVSSFGSSLSGGLDTLTSGTTSV